MNKRIIILLLFLVCFIQIVFSTNTTTSGMYLSYNVSTQTTQPNKVTFFEYVLSMSAPYYYSHNAELNQTTYNLNNSPLTYESATKLVIYKDGTSTIECESSFVNKLCDITYNSTYLSSNYYLSYAMCNNMGMCISGLNTFLFSPANYVQKIDSGFNLKFQVITNLPSATPIHYDSPPTPTNNQNSYLITNFTIQVNLEGKTVDNCIATINNTNYTMSLNDTHCYYTYTFTQNNNSKQTFDFQAYYNQSGAITQLEKRTINIYPNKKVKGEYPAIDLAGYYILTFLLSMYFAIGGVKK